jgi:hypothetical protein
VPDFVHLISPDLTPEEIWRQYLDMTRSDDASAGPLGTNSLPDKSLILMFWVRSGTYPLMQNVMSMATGDGPLASSRELHTGSRLARWTTVFSI